jgi:hypothetical protein
MPLLRSITGAVPERRPASAPAAIIRFACGGRRVDTRRPPQTRSLAQAMKVRRSNHAHVLLKVVESFSAALRAPGELRAIAKTAGALLEGIEGLLGLEVY